MIRDEKDIEKLLIATTELLADYHFEETESALIQSLETDPDNPEAHYTLGIIYTRRKEYDKAIRHLLKLETGNKESIYLHQTRTILGYIYALQGQYVKSKESLMKVLDFSKDNTVALSILGYVFYRAKLHEQALRIFDRALKVQPENAKLLNNIGYLLIETRINVSKGMEYVKKALRLSPNTPSYLDSLGWGYYQSGNYEKAVETLKQAFELAPDSIEIKNHIREIIHLSTENG